MIWVKIHTTAFRVYFYLNVYHAAYGGTGAECKKVSHAYSDTQKDVSRSKNVYHAPNFIKNPDLLMTLRMLY